MCGHVSTSVVADTFPFAQGYSGGVVTPPPPPPLQEQFPSLQFLLNNHELMIAADYSEAIFEFSGGSGNGYGGGISGCNSPSSLESGGGGERSVMQRSVSSNDGFLGHLASTHGPTLESGPVRRALSAGDLHRMNKKKGKGKQGRRGESELWSESNAIIQGMNRTAKYSPLEKKQRIERYKSKRSLRNFNKRIKYECRKTLADSRPRIRGRFARNDEIEDNKMMPQPTQDFDTAWASFLDSFSVNHFLN
ncbi:PREDICTED: two-component response regulator-like APRR7 [Tarenaya hassleriana]|uniref:two-component response regulator-like APRR7 n=1 Tax=Tarenaya hassleriana TaxID=28532 RepID=UPI00053C9032|nr:PREDICTED: two-component response regulator-like APRR7 [Tarenaya hassleriana]